MLSLTSNSLKSPTFTSLNPKPSHLIKPITTITISSSFSKPKPSQQQHNKQVYQPFRPPPSPIPTQYRSLDATALLDILTNRLGLWHQYAPLFPSLYNQGYTPASIEDITGISAIEQNRLIVAAQVRDSLINASNAAASVMAEFDTSGAELLYEMRTLSVEQRAAAARFVVEKKLDCRGVEDLAKATKDFVKRRGDERWGEFEYGEPGDCLAFMYYRQAKEHGSGSETGVAILEEALKVVASEKGRAVILKELEKM